MKQLTALLLFSFLLYPSVISQQKLSPDKVLQIARLIDQKVNNELAKQKIKPLPKVQDEVFLRRIYIDLIGRIPTIHEANSFFRNQSHNKRTQLINQLINSKGYDSQMFNYWADILRARDTQELVSGLPYVNYIKEAIAQNHSYKKFVTELLTSNGGAYAPGNGATGYFLRDLDMPLDNMANSIRIFLGTQMVCAQCHDHPFDRWTQKDFYQLAAFMSGMNTKRTTKTGTYAIITNKEKKTYKPEVVRQARGLFNILSLGVSGNGSGLIRLPKDYQYDDGKPYEAIKADVPFGPPVNIKPVLSKSKRLEKLNLDNETSVFVNSPGKDINSMKSFAEWVTSDKNDRFPKLIANRMWKKAMGIGIIEPVDDMSKNTMGTNPELMKLLMDVMIKVNYDLKEFQRIIYNTATYQSQSFNRDLKPGEKYYFQGPLLRRMGAEQVWDSLMVLIKQDIDKSVGPIKDLRHEKLYTHYKNMPKDEIFKSATILADDVLAKRDKKSTTKRKGKKPPKMGAQRRLSAVLDNGFARASELRSPAPSGHFLRIFGQSDREDVQNSNQDATVTQTLALMNGFVESEIINNKKSVLSIQLQSGDAIHTSFLSLLSRKPLSSEYKHWQAQKKHNKNYINDLIWVLVNSNEFLFIK